MEELVNVATHGTGLIASIVGLPMLILFAMRVGGAGAIIGVSIFGITLVGAYAASTMYHSLPAGPRKDFWLLLDQSAVYLLIAGTYTPFTLVALRGPWGWTLLATVWCAALLGIVVKLRWRADAPAIETPIYLALGWLVVVAINPLIAHIGWTGIAWLLGGGAAYTVGTIFLACQSRLRYGHCAWHVFVLVGSACHAVAVVNYAIRAA